MLLLKTTSRIANVAAVSSGGKIAGARVASRLSPAKCCLSQVALRKLTAPRAQLLYRRKTNHPKPVAPTFFASPDDAVIVVEFQKAPRQPSGFAAMRMAHPKSSLEGGCLRRTLQTWLPLTFCPGATIDAVARGGERLQYQKCGKPFFSKPELGAKSWIISGCIATVPQRVSR